MFRFETKIRVRYGEVDQMGYVYYGNYALYYEVARVESLRYLGVTYKEIEEMGILMPVLESRSKFIQPASYDEDLKIVTTICEKPRARIKFNYEIYGQENNLIHQGETALAFVDKVTKKPCRPPEILQNVLYPYFRA
jgi:acyl-CoA thioester hydrolase